MDALQEANYINILKSELVPALGCTEPIAIAYAAAKARAVLGNSRSTSRSAAAEIFLKM